jgi:hypothetical protein
MKTVVAALALLLVLGACSQTSSPSAGGSATAASEISTAVSKLDPQFNPTAVVSGALSADEVNAAFTSIPQIDQLKVMANASPAGARGEDVQSVSIVAQDSAGVLNTLDQDGKRSLGDSILRAAGTAWPKASVSLLITDPSGRGGQIIGSHPPGGANTVIVS